LHDPAQIEGWRREYQFHLALLVPGTPFDQHLRQASGWTLVRATRAANLYRYEEP
jgi:hypothetical protein